MPTHEFTIVLPGYDEITDDVECRVIAAGCDDGFLFARGGIVYLELERSAESDRAAYEGALGALARAGLLGGGSSRPACRSVSGSSVKNIQLPKFARFGTGTFELNAP